jgi:predicted nucleotidyltransferase
VSRGPATPASLLRLALAERLTPAYARLPDVVAVIAGGSAARGHADRFSDLEVGVIWAKAPTESERTEAIDAAGGDLVHLYAVEEGELGPIWSDAWKFGRRDDVPLTGVEVDMHHFLAETVDSVLHAVLAEFDPDPLKLSFVGFLLHGVPLHGSDRVRSWQERAATYPEELRRAVVRAHAQIEGLWRIDAYCARGNPVAGYAVLASAHEQLLQTLLGLNRVYFSGLKSLDAVTAELDIAPSDLLERMRASYPLRPGTSKDTLTGLIEETYDLIAEHLPEIDVERLRAILRYERPLWEE